MTEAEPARRRPIWARRTPLEIEDAARRTTAYVYGNILVLAALVAQPAQDVESGVAIWVVLGTAVSTFFAHAYAEMLGGQIRRQESLTAASVIKLARESLPVLTSGLFPTVVLLAGYLDWLDAGWSLWLAEAVVLLRIASTGIVVARLRDERSSFRLIAAGVAVAVVGFGISALKVYLTH